MTIVSLISYMNIQSVIFLSCENIQKNINLLFSEYFNSNLFKLQHNISSDTAGRIAVMRISAENAVKCKNN